MEINVRNKRGSSPTYVTLGTPKSFILNQYSHYSYDKDPVSCMLNFKHFIVHYISNTGCFIKSYKLIVNNSLVKIPFLLTACFHDFQVHGNPACFYC